MQHLKTTLRLGLPLAFSLALAGPGFAQAQVAPIGKIDSTVIADGLDHPWGLDFLSADEALVTERSGTLRIINKDGDSIEVSGGPEVVARGQGGLLDVALSPAFGTDGLVFLSFSESGDGGFGTAIARGRLVRDGSEARLEDLRTIFSMAKRSGTTRHFGSRIVFAPDGTLFFTIGDRGEGERAQDMRDHAGAVMRINADGSIPADNPSADGKTSLPEIWAKGVRNIQGAAFDPTTNALLTVEHGAKGGDEINRPEAGKNYGWPVIAYGVDYSGAKLGVGTAAEGYEQPLHYWDPSIAPSGMASYQADMFPEWKGDLLIGSLKFAYLARIDRDDGGKILGEEKLLEGHFGRIRDVNVAQDGSVWLLTDDADGKIVRLSRGD